VTPVVSLPLQDQGLSDRLTGRLGEVERRLDELTASSDSLVQGASRHLVQAGGKRLRPLLTLLAAELGDPGRPEVVEAAVVVELIHLASLYHDDVIDAAPLRRGAASAHEAYGNSVAILTGDLLFAKASQVVAGLGPEAVFIQAETFVRLCAGQIRESVAPGAGVDPVEYHLGVLADKTGSLIATSARLGALVAGCPAPVVEALMGYGEAVGVAFQLADDLIDLTADPQATGKTPGTDLLEGVPTMPTLLVQAEAAADLAAGRLDTPTVRLAQAIRGDLSQADVLADVVARLTVHPATGQARRIAESWSKRAVGHLAAIPPGPAKVALTAFAGQSTARLA